MCLQLDIPRAASKYGRVIYTSCERKLKAFYSVVSHPHCGFANRGPPSLRCRHSLGELVRRSTTELRQAYLTIIMIFMTHSLPVAATADPKKYFCYKSMPRVSSSQELGVHLRKSLSRKPGGIMEDLEEAVSLPLKLSTPDFVRDGPALSSKQ